jgi:putative hydrolase of the HAD superfamily
MASAAGLDEQLVRRLVLSETTLRRHETGELDPVTFYAYFCRETGAKVLPDALHAAAADIFTLNEEMLPLLESLAAAGERLGILSNTNEVHWQFITSGRFPRLLPGPFEQVVLSFEERCMKPDVAIYQAAARRAGVESREIFFVDDREENVAGALRAGVDAVLFQGVPQLTRELLRRGIEINTT